MLWTADEAEALRKALLPYEGGKKDWKKIAEQVPGLKAAAAATATAAAVEMADLLKAMALLAGKRTAGSVEALKEEAVALRDDNKWTAAEVEHLWKAMLPYEGKRKDWKKIAEQLPGLDKKKD